MVSKRRNMLNKTNKQFTMRNLSFFFYRRNEIDTVPFAICWVGFKVHGRAPGRWWEMASAGLTSCLVTSSTSPLNRHTDLRNVGTRPRSFQLGIFMVLPLGLWGALTLPERPKPVTVLPDEVKLNNKKSQPGDDSQDGLKTEGTELGSTQCAECVTGEESGHPARLEDTTLGFFRTKLYKGKVIWTSIKIYMVRKSKLPLFMRGRLESAHRREFMSNSLMVEPVYPSGVAFGYGQLQAILDSLSKDDVSLVNLEYSSYLGSRVYWPNPSTLELLRIIRRIAIFSAAVWVVAETGSEQLTQSKKPRVICCDRPMEVLDDNGVCGGAAPPAADT
ncbi:hypothetical protein AAG570_003750 [Ranatra chinensis]|uniref:Uncharacterized protein n=1 Tax=Ranatra chinensis TaxID=642074 RepID=A0ABD0Y4L7_9HEMI